MLTTYMQHDHITAAYRAGTASYPVAAIARELVDYYRADITGPQAIAAATDLDRHFLTASQVRRGVRAGGVTHDFVTAAVTAAKAA